MSRKDEEKLQRIREFNLMDDDFMTKCFEDSPECTELVLHIVLEKPDLKVQSMEVQRVIKNLQGRSVRLDIWAVDESGKKYNIEIQKENAGAGRKRARYNSSLIDANDLTAGEDTEKLPETYVIFITENDVLGMNEPLYHVDRWIAETGDSPLGLLMQDFFCKDPADMHYQVLADRVRYFKEDKEGTGSMGRIIEELIIENNKEIAISMIQDGVLPLEKIAAYVGLTLEEVQELAKIQTK